MGCYEAVEKRRLGLFKGMAIGAAVALVAVTGGAALGVALAVGAVVAGVGSAVAVANRPICATRRTAQFLPQAHT